MVTSSPDLKIRKSSNALVKCMVLSIFVFCAGIINAQSYPVYGDEIKVFISGYADHAMEPFLSPDGNTMFFNNLNSGDSTRLHYAARVDDSTFTYMGLVSGANEPMNPPPEISFGSPFVDGRVIWIIFTAAITRTEQ
jgi:hypothetical protein